MKEICRCLIFLHPVKHSMFTRAIFVRPNSELILESVCECAKLFVEKKHMAKAKTCTRKRHKKEDSASFV